MRKSAVCLSGVLACTLMFLFTCSGAFAQNSSPVPVGATIGSVTVKGNNLEPYDKILAVISMRPGDSISEAGINSDLKSVYALGYFSDVKAEFSKAKKGIAVTYKVVENPLLKGIEIYGNTVYSSEEILSGFKSKAGIPLSYGLVREDIASLEKKYHDAGYILAKVVDASSDPKTGVLNIRLTEGMIESLSIDGNTSTKDYVILREINSKPGTVMNEKVLGKDLRRLFNLGFFSEVTPDFQPGKSPDNVNLVIKIKEGKATTLNFGGGYGESEGWFGFVDLSTSNLFGTGQGVLLRGQSGQLQQTYQLRYTYPWLFPDKLGDRVLFTFKRWLTIGQNTYLLQTVENQGVFNGWEVGFNKPINDEWSTGLTLGSEKVDPIYITSFEPYTSDTIGLSLSYDTRDNWMNPSKGDYYTYGVRRGWKFASSGGTNFTNWSSDFNRFYSPFDRQTIAAHVGIGIGLGDVPVGELYYAGGANTVRGYEPAEARTGTKKVIFNLEYRYTFSDMFQGVLFYDWGNAWYTGWPNTYDFISGKGFGIRLNTPMGPIRLDYGIGSNRSFSEGALHFSIGQAF